MGFGASPLALPAAAVLNGAKEYVGFAPAFADVCMLGALNEGEGLADDDEGAEVVVAPNEKGDAVVPPGIPKVGAGLFVSGLSPAADANGDLLAPGPLGAPKVAKGLAGVEVDELESFVPAPNGPNENLGALSCVVEGAAAGVALEDFATPKLNLGLVASELAPAAEVDDGVGIAAAEVTTGFVSASFANVNKDVPFVFV